MAQLKNIVLLGASGNLGKFILRPLLADPSFSVTVTTRESSAASFPKEAKVARVPDDYPDDSMKKLFTGQDAVIFNLGHAASQRQQALIDVAAAVGVKRFISGEFGSNTRNAGAIEIFPMLGPKAQLNDYLKTKEATGLTWTAIATGPFFDFCLTTGFLGFNIEGHKATIYDSGDTAFSASSRAFIGDAVVAVLKHPEQTANKFIYVSSFETTPNKILAALENSTGQKFEVEHVKSDDMIVKGREELQAGNLFGGLSLLLQSATFRPGLGANFAVEESLANETLGLSGEDFEAVVERVVRTGE